MIDRAGVEALLVSSGMRAAMTGAGQDVAQVAQLTAPHSSGRLAASFRVEPTTATVVTKRDGQTRRASGRVVTDLPYAAAVEFGHLAGKMHSHAGFRWVVPGAYTLGRLAATKASKAAAKAARAARKGPKR
ncbi:HK97 gp10 family phage protein [Actinomyces israelii]